MARCEHLSLVAGKQFTESFCSPPVEAGWAREARFFLEVHEITGTYPMVAAVGQISPDGTVWCDENATPLYFRKPGLYSFALRQFGGWLRFAAQLEGDSPGIRLTVTLVLKD